MNRKYLSVCVVGAMIILVPALAAFSIRQKAVTAKMSCDAELGEVYGGACQALCLPDLGTACKQPTVRLPAGWTCTWSASCAELTWDCFLYNSTACWCTPTHTTCSGTTTATVTDGTSTVVMAAQECPGNKRDCTWF